MAFSAKTRIHDDKVDLIRLPISKRRNLYDFEDDNVVHSPM
jgi:hypothetical protein